MKALRSIGPLAGDEVLPLGKGDWRVEELDYDATDDPIAPLTKLGLRLKRLRIRISDPRSGPPATMLAKAPWWNGLERLELWLPGRTGDAAAVGTAFAAAAASLPGRCRLAVGVLEDGMRSGWTLAGNAKERCL